MSILEHNMPFTMMSPVAAKNVLVVLSVGGLIAKVSAFVAVPLRPMATDFELSQRWKSRGSLQASFATKKGFSNEAPSKKKRPSAVSPAEEASPQEATLASPNGPLASTSTASPSLSTGSTPSETNAGQRALAEMRRRRAEEKDEELRRVRELVAVDRQISTSPESAAIPEKVAQRMGVRMLPFVGLPLFGIMGAFVTFWYLATYKNLEFDTSLVAVSTIGILVVGLLVRSVWEVRLV
jgi:pyruvate/2-oxoglutarate dehydrogenase complex dihydrolipoamide acyltransferase (E2) component